MNDLCYAYTTHKHTLKKTHQAHMKCIKLSTLQEDKGDLNDHTNLTI